ncbi:hypothetical protein [Chelativorans salis]|uniref:Uncharacterized protein n=1 Tax=Chelativorans salis TaxID=2978478 RepID=A0ABT2LJA5_9HYPH|nr:hypothetical protein [Chelativorans sp. EGI FJ00035]MCT7374409.1 hypothetical protein [Chelativorans sp. EGI FJ00035]
MDEPENPDSKNPGEDAKSWYPRFKVPPMEPVTWRTEEQQAIFDRGRAEYCEMLGIYLLLFQALCTHHGFHRTCRIGKCRRSGRCCGRRPEDDWTFPLKPLIPPCVPLDAEVIEPLRDELRHAVKGGAAENRPEEGDGEDR